MRGGDIRFVSLIDSNVALCALARGRRSSAALRFLLKELARFLWLLGCMPQADLPQQDGTLQITLPGIQSFPIP